MLRYVFWIIFILCVYPAMVSAKDKKYALLIGNQRYTEQVGPLNKPHEDVKIIGAALQRLGFDVTTLTDAEYRNMDAAIKRYVAALRRAGPDAVGFFYYSGHGVANPENNINYLIPVDVERADTDDLWFLSFEQPTIIDRLNRGAKNATHFVIFDACRNELNLTASGKKALGAEKGFLPVGNVRGMLIAYATAEKRTASDSGQFAHILAQQLEKPGVEAVSMFRQVQLEVERVIQQEPWLTYGTLPQVYFAGEDRPEVVKWTEIRDSNSVEEFEAYLNAFPEGQFAESARLQIQILKERARNETATKDWQALETSTNIPALEGYINTYRDHPYAKFAASRIEALREDKARSEPLTAWNAVKDSGDVSLLQHFIERYPESFFAAVAADKISMLQDASQRPPSESELAAKYWEEIRDTDDPASFEKFVARFPNSPLKELAEVKVQSLKRETNPPQNATAAVETASEPAGEQGEASAATEIDVTQLTKSLQRELDRVGCAPGAIDGMWGALGRQAVERFNQHANLALDKITPTMAAIEAVREHKKRVCPKIAVATPTEEESRQRNTQAARRPDPMDYSLDVWPPRTLSTGTRASRNTKYGRLTCVGGSSRQRIPRRCHWN